MFNISRDMLFDFFARVVVLLVAMPVHECAHGLIADRLGDDTPAKQGRLTLNPFKHLDLVGSILLFFTGFGWGKPVEVDMRNFKHPRRDMALSALAGPVSNLIMAFIFLAAYKLILMLPSGFEPASAAASVMLLVAWAVSMFLGSAVVINIGLAVFNLLPVPPLDGSKIIGVLLPEKIYWGMMRYQRQISVIMLLLIFSKKLTEPLSAVSMGVYYVLDILTSPLGGRLLQ